MAGETYGLLVPPTGSTFVSGQTVRASKFEQDRQNFAVLGRPRYTHLGGVETDGHIDTSYARLRNAAAIELCAEDYRGLTLTLVVWVRVQAGTGTVRVRLRNTDDSSTVAEMAAAVSDTTMTRYEAAITVPTGATAKSCRLEILAGSAADEAYAFGGIEVKL